MKKALIVISCVLSVMFLSAQEPVIKVDLNIGSRHETEVNEPGYTPWPIATALTDTMTIQGITIVFRGRDTDIEYPSAFRAGWYKAGVQSPYYARLANDGMIAPVIEMTMKGLSPGTHSLLTYHNTYDNPTVYAFNPIRTFVNNQKVVDNLMPSNRETDISKVPTAYMTFKIVADEDVIIRFEPIPGPAYDFNQVTLCGFEINTPNVLHQAFNPYPAHLDEHVEDDLGQIELKWSRAASAASHDVYFGTDSATVAQAGYESAEYKGNQIDTTYAVNNLYSMDNYYWRIDEKSADGVITPGSIWYFKVAQLAFPGAEGYGRHAIGGRGGKVVVVTNLNDDGPGSLRDAIVGHVGPRTVVFNVSGMITLKSRLSINQPYITIAGQTAPGKGICIRQAPFGISGGNDNIIQHMRVRLGSGDTADGMGMSGTNYSIIDHSSISWTIDEAFSSRNGKNLTLQRTLISEALNIAGHKNYPEGKSHGFAATIGGDVGSFHHNLLAHCEGRNWSLGGGLDGNGYYAGKMDIFNNIVYNWGGRATDGGAYQVNFVNNYYKRGAANGTTTMLNAQLEGVGKGSQSYYYAGNVLENNNGSFLCDGTNDECGRRYSLSGGQVLDWQVFVDAPFFPSHATIHSAKDAYKSVLSDVGCTQPVLDDHDQRIIQETLNGTYAYTGSKSGKKGLPDSEQDVGGWENYPSETRAADFDSDNDGLPDWWEEMIGTNPNSAPGDFSDSNADPDRNGYTHLEEYLHWLMLPHYEMDISQPMEIDLRQFTAGYTLSPKYTISNTENCQVILKGDGKTAEAIGLKSGLAKFDFTVTDSEGSSMTRAINLRVIGGPSSTYSAALGSKLSIFPAIATDVIRISGLSGGHDIEKICVYDATGRKVLSSKLTSTELTTARLDVSKLLPGTYIVLVEGGIKAGRFVKL